MNEFDQFVKHELRVRHYARYTDDFVIVGGDRAELEALIPRVADFLRDRLALSLHPRKVSIRPLYQGIDFLGYVVFPKHRVVRTKTRRRMFAKLRQRIDEFRRGEIDRPAVEQSLCSYLGVLSHANAHELSEELTNQFWYWHAG